MTVGDLIGYWSLNDIDRFALHILVHRVYTIKMHSSERFNRFDMNEYKDSHIVKKILI